MNYEEAIKEVRENYESQNTEKLSQLRLWFAGEYAYLNQDLARILKGKHARWLAIRENVKSDTRADREWDGTKEGQAEILLRKTLKSIEILMTGLNSRLQVLQGENRSQM